MNMNYVAILLNSALYCCAVFVAGLVTGHDGAWKLAVVTLGLCYVTPTIAELTGGTAPVILTFLFVLSIITGAGAGLALLM